MGILSIFRRKKQTSSTKILSLQQKQEILTLRECGTMPAEISEELDVDVDKVCKVIELEKRKQIRVGTTGGRINPVIQATQELEAQRINLETEKLRFEQTEDGQSLNEPSSFVSYTTFGI